MGCARHCIPIFSRLNAIPVQALSLSALESLVIDEADLILSYGHDEDVRQIFGGSFLPKVFQTFLMSATMTEDVEALKGLALRSPVRNFHFAWEKHRTLMQHLRSF